jgi:hypothetical protein
MMCKDYPVHTVKEITSQQVPAYACHHLYSAMDYAIGT